MLTLLRWSIALLLAGCVAWFVVSTWRWPLIWDAQVFHYINFLVSRGWQPYRGITDINLPGAYLVDWVVLHTLGGGDLAWRLYDLLLLAMIGAAALVICRAYDWVAGLYAAVQFALWHALDGPYNTGQRDALVSALMIAGYAFLFSALRRRRPTLAGAFGFCMAAACTVKPMAAPLGMAVLALAVRSEGKHDRNRASLLWWASMGSAIPLCVVCAYLQHHHAFGALLDISQRLTPFYAGLNDLPLTQLLRWMLPGPMFVVLLLWLALFAVNTRARLWVDSDRTWERWAVVAGIAFGASSYLAQRKGYDYHRYPMVLFLLLGFAVEAGVLLQSSSRRRAWGLGALFFGAVMLVPSALRGVLSMDAQKQDQFAPALVRDLQALGGAQYLQRRVQCLDQVDGCLKALFQLRTEQSTGFTGDLLLFAPEDAPAVSFYRDAFLRELAQHPPEVFVLSNEWYGRPNSWNKVDAFPQLAHLLATGFHPVVERTFDDLQHSGYRVYVRNNAVQTSTTPEPQHSR